MDVDIIAKSEAKVFKAVMAIKFAGAVILSLLRQKKVVMNSAFICPDGPQPVNFQFAIGFDLRHFLSASITTTNRSDRLHRYVISVRRLTLIDQSID